MIQVTDNGTDAHEPSTAAVGSFKKADTIPLQQSDPPRRPNTVCDKDANGMMVAFFIFLFTSANQVVEAVQWTLPEKIRRGVLVVSG